MLTIKKENSKNPYAAFYYTFYI